MEPNMLRAPCKGLYIFLHVETEPGLTCILFKSHLSALV